MRKQRIRPLHTREDLISFVVSGVSHRRTLLRAITQGELEVLGGFKRVPPRGLPGWILLATSPITGQRYCLGVVTGKDGTHSVWNSAEDVIDWCSWVGDSETCSNNELMRGDNPTRYGELKHAATSAEEKGIKS